MYDVTTDNADTFNFVASDGTKVDFVKVTSKDNIQVRFPDDHDLADGQGNGRIFRRDGSHYKDMFDLTVSATAKPATAPAPAPVSAPVNPFAGKSAQDLDGHPVMINGHLFRLVLDHSPVVLAA